MPQQSVLRWPDGEGSLILSGGISEAGEGGQVEADVLARAPVGEPLVVIFAAGDIDTAEIELERLNDLGASSGYLLDVMTEDDETIKAQLRDVGLIVISDGGQPDRLRSALVGAAAEAIRAAYQAGAHILGVGAGVQVFGTIFPNNKQGLNWIENTAVLPIRSDDDSAVLNDLITGLPQAVGIGIAPGSALVLQGNGTIQLLGNREVTIRLSAAAGSGANGS